jgi:hypothetical protein
MCFFKENGMTVRKLLLLFILGSLLLGFGAVFQVPKVEAQCGSESSSCKDCHEVQAEFPVNSDGTGWHESHAFGDFCYICHAGNLQAVEADAAHEGMVPPLEDVRASCQSCHPDDSMELAQVYATALGIELGGAAPTPTQAPPPTDAPAEAAEQLADPAAVQASSSEAVAEESEDCPPAPADTELVVDDPNLVNYVQRYNEIVLGERPVNWGNITLVGLIVLIVLGGGGFVVFNELHLHRASTETAAVEGEYPPDVVEMLPDIASLQPKSRRSLRNLLRSPEKIDKVLGLIDAVVSDDKPKE